MNQQVLDFLRDAQYRVGELTSEIDELLNIGELELPAKKQRLRLELVMFMKVLYEISYPLYDGNYNHLYTGDGVTYLHGWTETMILDEIEHLRVYGNMTEMPVYTFTPFWTEVINIIDPTQSPGQGIDVSGTYRQMLMFNASNQLVAVDMSPWGGMKKNESITSYFNGRL